MPEGRSSPGKLTDLENLVLRAMRLRHHEQYLGLSMDDEYLKTMARAAVEILTTGSASGRRRGLRDHRRYPDPGSTPENIRRLARYIEGSFTTMPNGWVSADDEMKEHPSG